MRTKPVLPPKRKHRMTRQRRVILDAVRELDSHPTADEVYGIVRQQLPRISLGTVYRNLEILSELNLTQKLELGGSQKRFDGDIRKHYHVRCTRCGRVEDAPIKPLDSIENALQGISDYEIMGHRLEFIGLCPQCKKEKEAGSRSGERG